MINIDIYNIKKTMSKIRDMEDYDFTTRETEYLIQAAGFDLMEVSSMRTLIILMGTELERLRSLSSNLEQALHTEMNKQKG